MSRKLDLRKFDLSGSRRAESSMRHAAAWALAAASICALAALPAPAAGESPGASASVSAEEAPVSASATVTVADPSGKASEVLQLLTIPQLESILGAAPGQLTSVVEKLTGGPLGPKLRELLAGPKATLKEVLALLAEEGVPTAPLENALASIVGAATETPAQLGSVLASTLADLGEDGGLSELAHELGLPPAALEATQLLSGTAGQAAEALGTHTLGLSSVLMSAGAIEKSLVETTPVVVSPVERVTSSGTTLVIGSPTGTGGVTLTTVHSTSPPPSGVAGFKAATISNAFTILSVKVTKTGAIQEKVRLPGPGRLSVLASTTKTVAHKSSHSRARTRTVKVASTSRSTSGGTLTVTLHPRGIGTAKRTRVTLATTYAPTGGSPRTLKRFATISRRGGKRHK